MRLAYVILSIAATASPVFAQYDPPKISDPRLVVELFAAAPDIVHPISLDFDAKGRLLVIESHTHFAPKDYKGPKFDRIRMVDPSLGARAPKFTTFFEGTRHTMDLAVHPDGSVYIATRNEILRLRDTKGAGVADEKTRIVFLDTKGDYPHNGLSGLCFDSKGDLIFGMGENLGAPYTLIGSDGVKFSGHGDGGHVFHCGADGKKLRRIATGFWNPFGTCRDIYGRLFTVDNDPDQSPPCRMLHVVEGGDYGFQFRYGRSGKHPFQSWHGELPGTLPMMTGVGEAPCEILSYESDGLPKEYRGQLLVTSWADHRVERYAVKPHGASFKADRLPFIQGGQDFRPVGLATAPDGSLFFSDWVKRDYTLHGHGAIWHVRWKDAPKVERPTDPEKAILSMHRPLREAAAKKLAKNPAEWKKLTKHVLEGDVRVRAAALTALCDADSPIYDYENIEMDLLGTRAEILNVVADGSDLGMRELTVRTFNERKQRDQVALLFPTYPGQVRFAAISSVTPKEISWLIKSKTLNADDPFLRHAAIYQLRMALTEIMPLLEKSRDSKDRIAALLATRHKHSEIAHKNDPDDTKLTRILATVLARDSLKNVAEDVRFLGAKWIADEKLSDCRDDVVKAMKDPKLNVRMYMAYATALARLDGQEVNEKSLANYFAMRLADEATPPGQRVLLLRQVPATHPKLTVDLLGKLLAQNDDALKLEAVRALAEHPNPKRSGPLLDVLRNPKLGVSLRAFAMLGLADRAEEFADEFAKIARNNESPLQLDALRALIGVRFKDGAIGNRVEPNRPPAKDLDAWMKRLEGRGDAEVGARVFFHPKLGGCFKCHRVDGRGKDVGPDLSTIGQTDRRHLLESILQPSNNVAPHYQVWHLETADGKVRNGMLLDTNFDNYTYLDANGGTFKVNTRDVVETRPLPISIMPDGLAERMTDQEMRDLLAYLQSRK